MNPWQTVTPVDRVYVLPRCNIELWEDAGDGVLGDPVWTAEEVENVRIREELNTVFEHRTGIPYAKAHHLDERHEIVFDAVWNVDAVLGRNTEYILGITFQDASLYTETRHWVRRFYHGVTTQARDLQSRDGNEFVSSNTLIAQYMEETDGGAAAPGAGGWDNPVVGSSTPTTLIKGYNTC